MRSVYSLLEIGTRHDALDFGSGLCIVIFNVYFSMATPRFGQIDSSSTHIQNHPLRDIDYLVVAGAPLLNRA